MIRDMDQDLTNTKIAPFNVSVIIPAYNAASTIAQTLNSLLNQTYQGWEAIVVDDGSTDRTVDVVSHFIELDARIRLTRQSQGGEAAARNTGISLAKYDWLLFLDADDWISNLHLEKLIGELASNPEFDAVHCGSARVSPDGTMIVEKFVPPVGDLFPVLARRPAFNVHACIVRKSIVEALGKFDTSLKRLPDWDLWQRIARTGAKFGGVREVLAFYRMRPNSASLDVQQVLKDGLRVLRRGHDVDPRVQNPDPGHASGLPKHLAVHESFYFLCWCAGLNLGYGLDARPLLAHLEENDHFPGLYPDAVAECIFEAAPLSTCLPPHRWEKLALDILQNIELFLIELEKQSRAPDLASRAGSKLKELILKASPNWAPLIHEYEARIQKQQSVLDELNTIRMELEREKEQSRISIEKLQESAAVSESELRNIRDLAEQRLHQFEQAETNVQRLGNERDVWQKLAEEREQTITENRSRITDLQKERNQLKERVTEANAEIEDKGRAMQHQDGEIQQLQVMHRELLAETNHWKQTAAEQGGKLSSMRKHPWIRAGKFLKIVPPDDPVHSSTGSSYNIPRRVLWLSGLAILISALQSFLFLFEGPSNLYDLIALFLAFCTIFVAIHLIRSKKRSSLRPLFVFTMAQTVIFFDDFFGTPRITAPTLFTNLVIILHLVAIASFLWNIPKRMRRKAVLFSSGIALVILLLAWIVPLLPAPQQDESVDWTGKMIPHPQLGAVFQPNSKQRTTYRKNPRNYFLTEDMRKLKYWLRVEAADASLVFPADQNTLRVEIRKTETPHPYDVQLNQSRIAVKTGERYSVRFRGRADQPRNIFLGFARSHGTWDGLGLYEGIQLTAQWQSFEKTFTASATEENGRIHFDLGGQNIPVELDAIQIVNSHNGTAVKQDLPPSKHFVEYRFNSASCRGPDPAKTEDSTGTRRVLLLGDSFTLGVGVHEKDTVANRLQTILNENQAFKGPVEVLNCSVSGYGTREERLFFNLVQPQYEPGLVLLVMTANDDKRYSDDVVPSLREVQPGILSRIKKPFEQKGDATPLADFTGIANEILKLDREIKKTGGRLAIVLFRVNPDFSGQTIEGRNWNLLESIVTQTVKGTGIPLLNLGKPLFAKHQLSELVVDLETDHHPNHVAHAIAAEEISKFLMEHQTIIQ